MKCRFRSFERRIHGVPLAVNHIIVDAVFDVRSAVGHVENFLLIGFIFREKKFGFPVRI